MYDKTMNALRILVITKAAINIVYWIGTLAF